MEDDSLDIAPTQAPQPQKKSKKRLILTVLGVVVLLASCCGGVYYWQHQQVKQLQSEVDSLKAKVAELEKAADEETAPAASTSTSSDEVTITLKELGIRFTGPSTLGDLTYVYEKNDDYNGMSVTLARLSSKSLTDFDAGCSAEGKAPPLGYIAKVPGQFPAEPTADNAVGLLIKQFPTYYIGAYLNAQSACSDKDFPAALQAKTTQLRNDLTEALKSLQQL